MNVRIGPEQEVDLLFDEVPSLREARTVCSGIQWVRLPLPFALDHVNCWLLGEGTRQVLVDTGIGRAESRDHWSWLFGERDGYLRTPPERLLVTHFHPDHSGLAGWFAQSGSRLLGSRIEVGMARALRELDDQRYGSHFADWYVANGLPAQVVERARETPNLYRRSVHELPGDEQWQFLVDNEQLELGGEIWRVIVGRGHAPDMLMLFRERDAVLIAADQVLPGISPNVSVMPHLVEDAPLRRFLDTLAALKQLPVETLVLPSHGVPFRGLHRRIEALERHHEERLQRVRQACVQPVTAHDLFPVLFRRELDAQQMSFALGESLAHLHHLEQSGLVHRQQESQVTRFSV